MNAEKHWSFRYEGIDLGWKALERIDPDDENLTAPDLRIYALPPETPIREGEVFRRWRLEYEQFKAVHGEGAYLKERDEELSARLPLDICAETAHQVSRDTHRQVLWWVGERGTGKVDAAHLEAVLRQAVERGWSDFDSIGPYLTSNPTAEIDTSTTTRADLREVGGRTGRPSRSGNSINRNPI